MQLAVASNPRGGVAGLAGWLGPNPGQSTAAWCASWESLTSPSQLYCLVGGADLNNVAGKVAGVGPNASTPTLPPPPPPGVTFSNTAKDDTSVYAGKDAEGNPVYVTPQTPEQNVQQYAVELQQFFGGQDFAAPVDCSSTLSSLFNPVCGNLTNTLVWGLGIIAVAVFVLTSRAEK